MLVTVHLLSENVTGWNSLAASKRAHPPRFRSFRATFVSKLKALTPRGFTLNFQKLYVKNETALASFYCTSLLEICTDYFPKLINLNIR